MGEGIEVTHHTPNIQEQQLKQTTAEKLDEAMLKTKLGKSVEIDVIIPEMIKYIEASSKEVFGIL